VPAVDAYVDTLVRFLDFHRNGATENPDLDAADSALREGLTSLPRIEIDRIIQQGRAIVDRIVASARDGGWSELNFGAARTQLATVWADLFALVWKAANPGKLSSTEKALANAEKAFRDAKAKMNAAIDRGDEEAAIGLRDDCVYRLPAAIEMARVAFLDEQVNIWARSVEMPAERADQAQRKIDQAEAAYYEARSAMVTAEEGVLHARLAAILPGASSGSLRSRVARLSVERDNATAAAEVDKRTRLRTLLNLPASQLIDERSSMTVVHPQRQSIDERSYLSQLTEVM
jgi:hypothetical protein